MRCRGGGARGVGAPPSAPYLGSASGASVESSTIAAISLIVSIISLIAATVIGVSQYRLSKRLAKLQEPVLKRQGALHAYDLQERAERRAERETSRITVEADRGGSEVRFLVKNTGGAPARNVTVEIRSRGKGRSPLMKGEAEGKLPIPELRPGQTVPLLGTITFQVHFPFDVEVRWVGPDGTEHSDSLVLH